MAPPCITEGEHAATGRKRIQPPCRSCIPKSSQAAIASDANRVGGPNPHFV
jgi:hypothetical protein